MCYRHGGNGIAGMIEALQYRRMKESIPERSSFGKYTNRAINRHNVSVEHMLSNCLALRPSRVNVHEKEENKCTNCKIKMVTKIAKLIYISRVLSSCVRSPIVLANSFTPRKAKLPSQVT